MGDLAGTYYTNPCGFRDPITHADWLQQAYRWSAENVNQKRRLTGKIH